MVQSVLDGMILKVIAIRTHDKMRSPKPMPTHVEQTAVTTDTNQVKEEDQAGMLSTPPTGMQHSNSFKTGTLFACLKC